MPSRRAIQVVDVGRTTPITEPRTRGRQVLRQINLKSIGRSRAVPKTFVTVRSAEPAEFSSKDVIARETWNIEITGGGTVINTGEVGGFSASFNGRFVSVHLAAGQSGSIVLDIWKDTYANIPPTAADTITASAKPTLASAQRYEDLILTGWTLTFVKGDWFWVNVDSVATIQWCTMGLTVERD